LALFFTIGYFTSYKSGTLLVRRCQAEKLVRSAIRLGKNGQLGYFLKDLGDFWKRTVTFWAIFYVTNFTVLPKYSFL
jgi:hypothetical protein